MALYPANTQRNAHTTCGLIQSDDSLSAIFAENLTTKDIVLKITSLPDTQVYRDFEILPKVEGVTAPTQTSTPPLIARPSEALAEPASSASTSAPRRSNPPRAARQTLAGDAAATAAFPRRYTAQRVQADDHDLANNSPTLFLSPPEGLETVASAGTSPSSTQGPIQSEYNLRGTIDKLEDGATEMQRFVDGVTWATGLLETWHGTSTPPLVPTGYLPGRTEKDVERFITTNSLERARCALEGITGFPVAVGGPQPKLQVGSIDLVVTSIGLLNGRRIEVFGEVKQETSAPEAVCVDIGEHATKGTAFLMPGTPCSTSTAPPSAVSPPLSSEPTSLRQSQQSPSSAADAVATAISDLHLDQPVGDETDCSGLLWGLQVYPDGPHPITDQDNFDQHSSRLIQQATSQFGVRIRDKVKKEKAKAEEGGKAGLSDEKAEEEDERCRFLQEINSSEDFQLLLTPTLTIPLWRRGSRLSVGRLLYRHGETASYIIAFFLLFLTDMLEIKANTPLTKIKVLFRNFINPGELPASLFHPMFPVTSPSAPADSPRSAPPTSSRSAATSEPADQQTTGAGRILIHADAGQLSQSGDEEGGSSFESIASASSLLADPLLADADSDELGESPSLRSPRSGSPCSPPPPQQLTTAADVAAATALLIHGEIYTHPSCDVSTQDPQTRIEPMGLLGTGESADVFGEPTASWRSRS